MAEAPNTPIRTVEAQGMPGARVDQTAPISAFGGGESLAQSTNAIQNLAGQAQDLAVQEIQKQNQVAHLDAMNKAQDLQTQLQIQTSKMYGKDAAAAPDVAEKSWQDGVQKIRDSLANGTQRAMFDRSSSMLWHSLNRSVQTHVSQQMQAYDDQTTSSFIDNSKTAAVLNANDPARVDLELAKQKAALADWAKRKGIPTDSEIFQSKLTDTLSQTHTGVIQSNLDTGNTKAAEAYFAQNKANMSAGDELKMAKAIEQNKDVSLGLEIYNQVKGMKLSDGRTPDEGKMEADIMGRSDLSDEKKIRMVQFVKARAREDLGNMYRADQARDRAFMDQAIKGRQSGLSLDDALKQVPKYSIDAYDQQTKEAAIQKMYAPPDETDVHTKVALWNGIEDGTVTKIDFDNALKSGKITDKDYFTGITEFHKAQVEGRSPQMRVMNAQIKELARTTFGNDADKIATFQDTVNMKAMGKTADQKWVLAQEELKTAPGTGWFGSDWFAQKKYDVDSASVQKNETSFGNVANDIGDDNLRALKAGAVRMGRDLTPEALNSMTQQFGGYENFLPGKPVYNAIQLLRSQNKPVVPENIQYLFDKGIVKGGPAAPPPAAPKPAAPAPAPEKTAAPAKKGKGVSDLLADAKDFVVGDAGKIASETKKALFPDDTAGGATDFASRYNR